MPPPAARERRSGSPGHIAEIATRFRRSSVQRTLPRIFPNISIPGRSCPALSSSGSSSADDACPVLIARATASLSFAMIVAAGLGAGSWQHDVGFGSLGIWPRIHPKSHRLAILAFCRGHHVCSGQHPDDDHHHGHNSPNKGFHLDLLRSARSMRRRIHRSSARGGECRELLQG